MNDNLESTDIEILIVFLSFILTPHMVKLQVLLYFPLLNRYITSSASD